MDCRGRTSTCWNNGPFTAHLDHYTSGKRQVVEGPIKANQLLELTVKAER